MKKKKKQKKLHDKIGRRRIEEWEKHVMCATQCWCRQHSNEYKERIFVGISFLPFFPCICWFGLFLCLFLRLCFLFQKNLTSIEKSFWMLWRFSSLDYCCCFISSYDFFRCASNSLKCECVCFCYQFYSIFFDMLNRNWY